MNSETKLRIFDDLDESFCEHAALSVSEGSWNAESGDRKISEAVSGKTRFFTNKRNRLIAAAAAVLIAAAVLMFGPWPPKHANNTSEVRPSSGTTASSVSVSRSVAIKDIPKGSIYKELTEADIAPVFKDAALKETAPFTANANVEYTKYEAYFYNDGTLITLKLSWTFNGGSLTVSFEPDTSIPKNPAGFVKPWDKPTIVNGWEVYLCQLSRNIAGSEQVVLPNEYDLYMSKDGLVIHAFCFAGVLDDMLELCDNLTRIEIDLNTITP